MNIKKIQLEIIQTDSNALDADLKITECSSLDQESIRETIESALTNAQENRYKSLLFLSL